MLARDGYCLHPSVFTAEEMRRLADQLPAVERAGTRSLLDAAPVVQLAQDARLGALVGAGAFVVRALLFDKTAASNWSLRWHQDLAIAVSERRDAPGFTGWTVKAGVPHVHAPAEVLDGLVTLRVHLDDSGAEAGPLRVVPGSHRRGRLDADALEVAAAHERACLAKRGDVLAFKPLLLHASSASSSTTHRRVLQLECARAELPSGLAWRWRVPLG